MERVAFDVIAPVSDPKTLASPEAIVAGLSEEERTKAVQWLLKFCGLSTIDDGVLFSAVALVDRYCAACAAAGEPLTYTHMHRPLIAILGIALKVVGGLTPRQLADVLSALCQQLYSMEDIFVTELEVLQTLGFDVTAPNPLDFLHVFTLQAGMVPTEASIGELAYSGGAAGTTAMSPVACLAKFLLHLSVLDVGLLHKYPYSVLAAGAMYVALWCVGERRERFVGLLKDLDGTRRETQESMPTS